MLFSLILCYFCSSRCYFRSDDVIFVHFMLFSFKSMLFPFKLMLFSFKSMLFLFKSMSLSFRAGSCVRGKTVRSFSGRRSWLIHCCSARLTPIQSLTPRREQRHRSQCRHNRRHWSRPADWRRRRRGSWSSNGWWRHYPCWDGDRCCCRRRRFDAFS